MDANQRIALIAVHTSRSNNNCIYSLHLMHIWKYYKIKKKVTAYGKRDKGLKVKSVEQMNLAFLELSPGILREK